MSKRNRRSNRSKIRAKACAKYRLSPDMLNVAIHNGLLKAEYEKCGKLIRITKVHPEMTKVEIRDAVHGLERLMSEETWDRTIPIKTIDDPMLDVARKLSEAAGKTINDMIAKAFRVHLEYDKVIHRQTHNHYDQPNVSRRRRHQQDR